MIIVFYVTFVLSVGLFGIVVTGMVQELQSIRMRLQWICDNLERIECEKERDEE